MEYYNTEPMPRSLLRDGGAAIVALLWAATTAVFERGRRWV